MRAKLTIGLLAGSLAVLGCGNGGGSSRSGTTTAGSTAATPTTGTGTTGTTTGTPGTGTSTGTTSVTPVPLPAGPVGGPRVEGVDVSEFQGTIDWAKVASAGIGFGIARVSDGTGHPDPTFAANWSGMKSHGLVRGVYQFFRASQDPVAQADLLVKAVGTFAPGDLPPVADVEVMDGQTASTLTANLTKWIDEIKAKTGLTPIIYTAPGFWSGLNQSFSDEDLWVAHWGVSSPTLPYGWRGWFFWQYSDNGSVSGISGAVDRDVFQGSIADLRAYAGLMPSADFSRGVAVDSTGQGFWACSKDGGVFEYGDATFRGTAGGATYAQPFLGIVRTPTGFGYWLFAADGAVSVFGDAVAAGNLAGQTLSAPIVGMAATPSGKGYWLVQQDGVVHTFGDAQSFGQPSTLASVVVGFAATPTGRGYWLACADGGVVALGDAVQAGAATSLTNPIVAMAPTKSGQGYWLVESMGTVHAFGDAGTFAAATAPSASITGITATLTGGGYWLVAGDGSIQPFGDAFAPTARCR